MFIDTHAHFDICLEDRSLTEEGMLSSLKENNVQYAVQVSTEVNVFEWSYHFAKKNKDILFTIGIHPSSRALEQDLSAMSAFVKKTIDLNDRNILFGIGEIGLDYFRMHQPKEMQKKSFEYQLDVAKQYNLPVIIHSREATDDTLDILKKKKPGIGIMHCFAGDSSVMKKFLDLGFYISFAGNLTYSKAIDLHDAAKNVPFDRVLLETDAPYLTPVPFRGKKNRPEYIVNTYKYFAELRNEKLSNVEDNIYNNFLKIK
jgi:TatD DNase family protein